MCRFGVLGPCSCAGSFILPRQGCNSGLHLFVDFVKECGMLSATCPAPVNRFNKTIKTTLIIGLLSAAAAAQTAFVRVNQVGYGSGQAKRAYLMSSSAETGASFAVKNSSGTAVFTGPIGANLGAWSRTYKNVYALDF